MKLWIMGQLVLLGTPVGCTESGHAAGPRLPVPDPMAGMAGNAMGPIDTGTLKP